MGNASACLRHVVNLPRFVHSHSPDVLLSRLLCPPPICLPLANVVTDSARLGMFQLLLKHIPKFYLEWRLARVAGSFFILFCFWCSLSFEQLDDMAFPLMIPLLIFSPDLRSEYIYHCNDLCRRSWYQNKMLHFTFLWPLVLLSNFLSRACICKGACVLSYFLYSGIVSMLC